MFSIDGLVSGLDTTSIIDGLISLQDAQVGRLNERRDKILSQQTAFQGVEARLLSFRSAMSALNRSSGSAFDLRTVASNREDIITATAEPGAIEGSYSVQVNALAKAHQIASQGFSSTSAAIPQGDLSFKLGDRPATSITIDSSNNTVAGLVSAINSQSDDISAAIIHEQSTGTDRILLTSRLTGASNQIAVTNNLGAGSPEIVRPDFTGPAIQDASNAVIQLGSGIGAITAEYETNQIEGLIENVTLNLAAAEVGQDVTVTVAPDSESAEEAIREFVDQYNSVISYIDDQTRFNPETEEASPLLGNRSISTLRNQLSTMVTETVPGLGSKLNRLSQIGIDIGTKGKLSIDSAKLTDVLSGGEPNVDLGDVKRLFGFTGESNNSGVQFLLGSSRTQASTTPYQVDILQAAERGEVTATNVLATTIVIDGTNNELQINIDGQASEIIQLTAGTYTQQELADHLQSTINASSELGGRDVSIGLTGSALNITSESYGSNSTVGSLSGSALSVLGFDGTEAGVGKDVAGSFIVDGVVETATGTGRLLISDSDNEFTADLQIRVTLQPSQVGPGPEAELAISRGISSQLDFFFGEVLKPDGGSLSTVSDEFDLRIESLDASIERVKAISEQKREYLIKQFSVLERVLSDLKTTSGFLSTQLASIQNQG